MIHIHPQFVMVGAPKAGTTSVYNYLFQHPMIFMPSKKEPVFFCGYQRNFTGPGSHSFNKNLVVSVSEYAKLFRNAPRNSLAGEASTDYLSCPNAAHNIKKWNPDTKIIIILRNPIERAFSEHNHLIRVMLEERSFLESLMLEELRIKAGYTPLFWHVKRGLYSEGVSRYINLFGRKNVAIFFYEELKTSAKSLLGRIFDFLSIPSIRVNTELRYNISGVPRSTMLHKLLVSYWRVDKDFPIKRMVEVAIGESVRKRLLSKLLRNSLSIRNGITEDAFLFLKSKFQEDIQCLEEMLEVNLKHWIDFSYFQKKDSKG